MASFSAALADVNALTNTAGIQASTKMGSVKQFASKILQIETLDTGLAVQLATAISSSGMQKDYADVLLTALDERLASGVTSGYKADKKQQLIGNLPTMLTEQD